MHGPEVMTPFFRRLRSTVLSHCDRESHRYYNDAGWLRLFVHEILTNVEFVIFVDAGDYIFLEDPALLLQHRSDFGPEQLIGAPAGGHWTVQLTNIARMQQANFTRIVLEAIPARQDGKFQCGMGEGLTLGNLASMPIWHQFDQTWCFEPREQTSLHSSEWQVDVWGKNIWNERIYPGARAWTDVVLHCPSFIEGYMSLLGKMGVQPIRLSDYTMAYSMAVDWDWANMYNASLLAGYICETDLCNTAFCNQKIKGLHFPAGLKAVPFWRKFMDFWIGHAVWEKEELLSFTDRLFPKGK